MKVAVYGGSFDPLHLAHIKIVEKILTLDIDKLFIIPTFINVFKEKFFLPPKLRFKMLKKVFRDKKISILNYEIRQKRPTPSYKSVTFIKKNYKIDKIYLVIGADNLKYLKKWYNYKRLKKIVEFIIVKRNNIKVPKQYKIIDFNYNISSSHIRKYKDFYHLPKNIKKGVQKHWKEYKI